MANGRKVVDNTQGVEPLRNRGGFAAFGVHWECIASYGMSVPFPQHIRVPIESPYAGVLLGLSRPTGLHTDTVSIPFQKVIDVTPSNQR